MFDNEEDTFERLGKMPLFKKGIEIREVVKEITALIDDEDEHLHHFKQFILEDAYMLTAKIANAEGGDLYDIRMENAAIIRKSAKNLMLHNHTLEMFGFEHVEYYRLVRKLVEEYRLLFIEWVDGFDKTKYTVDRWGVFNPPGVGPYDSDPDDDPFEDEGRKGFFDDDEE